MGGGCLLGFAVVGGPDGAEVARVSVVSLDGDRGGAKRVTSVLSVRLGGEAHGDEDACGGMLATGVAQVDRPRTRCRGWAALGAWEPSRIGTSLIGALPVSCGLRCTQRRATVMPMAAGTHRVFYLAGGPWSTKRWAVGQCGVQVVSDTVTPLPALT